MEQHGDSQDAHPFPSLHPTAAARADAYAGRAAGTALGPRHRPLPARRGDRGYWRLTRPPAESAITSAFFFWPFFCAELIFGTPPELLRHAPVEIILFTKHAKYFSHRRRQLLVGGGGEFCSPHRPARWAAFADPRVWCLFCVMAQCAPTRAFHMTVRKVSIFPGDRVPVRPKLVMCLSLKITILEVFWSWADPIVPVRSK